MLNEIGWLSSNEDYFCCMRGGENLTESSEKTINRHQRGTGRVKTLLQDSNKELIRLFNSYGEKARQATQNTEVCYDGIKSVDSE